jgi:hypothetical protein
MFNLLVTHSGWNLNRGSLPRIRVLEHTTVLLKEQFKPSNVLDAIAVARLPTLFMAEIGGDDKQLARVGSISTVREHGSDYQLEYAYDPAIPPIPNTRIAELGLELDLGRFELSRTHWAIKDVDLFQVLLRNGSVRGPSPTVFQLSEDPVDNNLVSVMMPFNAGFNEVYDALAGAVQELGKRCQRADNIWTHDEVIQDVVSLIHTSSIVVCDLTGRNANVFYKTGIAHTLGKNVILITQSEDDVPFDIGHLRYIRYLNNGEGRARLAEQVCNRIRTLGGVR